MESLPPNFMGPCKKLNRKNIFWLSPPFRDSKTMLRALMMTFYPSTIKCFISSVVHVGVTVAFWKPIYLHIPYQPPNTKTFLYQSISLVHLGKTVASIAEKKIPSYSVWRTMHYAFDSMFKTLLYKNRSLPSHIKWVKVHNIIIVVIRYDVWKEQQFVQIWIYLLHDVSPRNPRRLCSQSIISLLWSRSNKMIHA